MSARNPADVDHLFGERINAGDLDGTVALYETDGTLVGPEDALLVGHDAIRGFLAGLVAMKATIDMGTVKVVPMGEDLAVLHHDWRATATGADGQATVMTGKATEIVRRQPDGSWLFVLDDPNMRD